MTRVGFLINPIAGMGGRVGLKGTDNVVEEARRRGAQPFAHERALACLREFVRLQHGGAAAEVEWLSCGHPMGRGELAAAGIVRIELVYTPGPESTRADTLKAAQAFAKAGVDVILFCGGDGTARDLCTAVAQRVPLLGIPAGVKMYSGVFGLNPLRTAEILHGLAQGEVEVTRVDVLDLDEEQYRQGEWVVRLYHQALAPYETSNLQSAKLQIEAASDDEVKHEIADYLDEIISAHPDVLFLLGPGSTVQTVAERLALEKTLLGVDAIAGGRTVGVDLNEARLLALTDQYRQTSLILSPIGAQGFVLGRGNLQLSPAVVRRIGRERIIVIATPAKLARTPVLHFDTGDRSLDASLVGNGFLPVLIAYGRRRLVRVQA